jgi:DNA ligase-1
MSAVKDIIHLKNIKSREEKLGFIIKRLDDDLFIELIATALDPFTLTYIKKIPEYTQKLPVSPVKDRYVTFKALINFLGRASGNAEAKEMVSNFLADMSDWEAEIYGEVITKKLRLGLSAKALADILPGRFSVFSLMKGVQISTVKKLTFPLAVEEKFDGVRCAIMYRDGAISAKTYNGKTLVLPTLFKEIEKFVKTTGEGNFLLDGELEHKSRILTAGIVNKIIKNNTLPPNIDEDLSFKVFDFVPIKHFDAGSSFLSYKNRRIVLESLFNTWVNKRVVLTPSIIAHNMDEVNIIFKDIIARGGEGVMLKNLSGGYVNKKSNYWIKLKGVYSTSLKVINIKEGTGKNAGMVGALEVSTSDGIFTTWVGTGLDDKEAKEFFKDPSKIIGKIVEIKFNGGHKCSKGFLWLDFCVYKHIRGDKTEADDMDKLLSEFPASAKEEK